MQQDDASALQPFYTTKRNGLGMGLPISRSIIEAHGGRLWAESNADLGLTFLFHRAGNRWRSIPEIVFVTMARAPLATTFKL